LHGPVRVAQTVGTGNAKVTIAFDSWKDGSVAPSQHEIPVVAPHSRNIKLEAVSSRLKGELIHPNKNGNLANVMFSPDGSRILAGDYPGGVIALWDVASGKRLTTIEAGYGYHATASYFAVAPDWRTVFAWRENRKPERVEQDGKRMIRWTFGGEVRAWNLEDGKLLRAYKQQPQSDVRIMRLAPDGKTFYTYDELPGTYERGPKQGVSLWDIKAGTYRTLEEMDNGTARSADFSPDGKTLVTGGSNSVLSLWEIGTGKRVRQLKGKHARNGIIGVTFTPDGKSVAFPAQDKDGYSCGLKRIHVATGREDWSVPIEDKYALANVHRFSRDGRLLFGTVSIFQRPKQWDKLQTQVKWWNAATGREVASFACEENDTAGYSVLSPDGRILAVALNWWPGVKRKMMLINVPEKRLLGTIGLCERPEGHRPLASRPVFSPDGKWVVVITRSYPEKAAGDDLDPRDVPQPRISLIETTTGAIRETMIAPQSFSNEACFSPDGRTLATDSHGRVLLWDMTKMPAPTSR
jgi:WD40 repeat protein